MALSVTQASDTPGLTLWTYDNLDSSDTAPTSIRAGQGSLAGFFHVVGTFGSGTVVLQGSNDNTNWVTLNDVSGTAVSFTATGGADFSTAALYIRPLITGGSGDDVDVYITVLG